MAVYFPSQLFIETSDHCNRSCRFCPVQHARGTHPPRLIDKALFRRLLEELARERTDRLQISLQWIDEPLTNPEFFEYAELGRELVPDARWLLQSNGDFLTEERVARLKTLFDAVCLNFYGERAYERFVRAEYDVVPARFRRRLQTPGKLVRAFGFDHRSEEAIIHANKKFESETWIQWHDQIEVPPEARCNRLWVQAAIGWDGTVHLCCRDNDKAHPVGSLTRQTLFQCVNSEAAIELRQKMELGQREGITMCKYCPCAFRNPFEVIDAGADEAAARALETRRALGAESARGLPYGGYDYFTARRLARALGHISLPGILPLRYETIVGLTPELYRAIVETTVDLLGDRLLSVFVCGSRVMTRPRLLEVDPAVFEDENDPLTVGTKTTLREYGPDPNRSSDLDLKVFADESRVSEAEAARLGLELGAQLTALGAPFPVSPWPEPHVRVLRSATLPPREVFLRYNRARFEKLGRGPLSLEYTQLFFDPAAPDATMDPEAPIRARLTQTPGPLIELAELDLPEPTTAERFRSQVAGLSHHQLVIALLDHPELHPPPLRRTDQGFENLASAWAARAAGRTSVPSGQGPTRGGPK